MALATPAQGHWPRALVQAARGAGYDLDVSEPLGAYPPYACPTSAHGISRRRASATAANSKMPRMLSQTKAAQAKALSSCEFAVSSRFPNPLTEPTNSPITAPMTASVTATLAPE